MSYTLAYTGAEIDALLGKIKAIFVAEYGSTIYSEVTAAIAAGNKVIVANAGKVYVYAGQDDNSGYVFTQSGPNAAKPNATYVTLSAGNVWSTATVDLATLQQFYASLMEDTASGSIASFPDGAENVPVKELTAEIEPIQDLHGQASPYPESGGKNKLPYVLDTIKSLNTGGTWSGNTFSGSGLTMEVLTDNGGNITGLKCTGSVAAGVNISILLTGDFTLPAGSYVLRCNARIRFNKNGTRVFDSYGNINASGSTNYYEFTSDGTSDTFNVIIYCGNDAFTANNTVRIYINEASAEDTGFTPYSNICPISGYTGAEIYQAGGNIADVPFEQGAISGYDAPNKTYAQKKSNNNSRIRFADLIYLPVDTHCRVSFDTSTFEVVVQPYDSNGYSVSGGGAPFNVWQSGAFEFTSTGAFAVAVRKISQTEITPSEIDSVNLEVIATEQTYSVSWSDHGTVYKGTAEYKGGGEWKVTSDYMTFDMGAATWQKVATVAGKYRFIAYLGVYAYKYTDATTAGPLVCSIYKTISANDVYNGVEIGASLGVSGGSAIISIYDMQYADADAFKTGMTGQTAICQLATPVEFTISGPDPETLLGDNNMWANCGDISVKYRANTALYIEKKLGA